MEQIKVVAGVILNLKNEEVEVLLASRPASRSYSGYFEFPGGKVESNESDFNALARELKEEINITIDENSYSLINELIQQYPYGLINLKVFLVKKYNGTIMPMEQQEVFWHKLSEDLPVNKLFLPTTYTILEALKSSNFYEAN